MRDALENIKTYVREMRPYSLRFEPARIKLNQNENPWDMPIEIKRETFRRLQDRPWSRYPEFVPSSLIARLAEFSGWTADGIIAGNGSNELIQALLMVTVEEGKRVLISEPTFALYRQITTVLGGEVISLPLNADLSYDVTALKDAVRDLQPEVTIVCSPNNPTGNQFDKQSILEIIDSLDGKLILLDEAYVEFADYSLASVVSKYDNVIVIIGQTCSGKSTMVLDYVNHHLDIPIGIIISPSPSEYQCLRDSPNIGSTP